MTSGHVERVIRNDRLLLQRIRERLNSVGHAVAHSWLAQIDQWDTEYAALLEELASPPQVLITMVGGTGAGKSTLINALLGAPVLAVSNTRACTSAVTEVRAGDALRAFVEFVPLETWFAELQTYADELADLRDSSPEAESASLQGPLHKKICALYTEQAVSRFYEDLDVEYLRAATSEGPVKGDATLELRAQTLTSLRRELKPYVAAEGQYWPLVKEVIIEGPFAVLKDGARIVDLPGLNDPNRAREAVTQHYLNESQFVWLIYNMRRSLTREITDILQQRDLFRRLIVDGRYGGLAVIGTAADSIDPEVDAEEFDIDVDDELAIAGARGNASRAHVVEQLVELLDHLQNASGDGMAAIGETLRSRLVATPSFSVSARDYLDLIGKQKHRGRLFDTTEETGIPALATHVRTTVNKNGPAAHRHNIGERAEALRASIRYTAASSRRFSKHRATVTVPKEVEVAAHEARQFLAGAIDESLNELEVRLSTDGAIFSERVVSALDRAATRLGSVVASWGAIHWATLRATCRNGGTFYSSSGAHFDLPGQVGGSFFDTVALAWTDYFGERLRSCVGDATKALVVAASRYRAELAEVLIPLLGGGGEMRGQRRAIETAVEQLVKRKVVEVERRIDTHVKEERRNLYDLIGTQVRKAMSPAMAEASQQSGRGMKGRILDIIQPAAIAAMDDTGPVILERVGASADHLSRWIAGEMKRVGAEAQAVAVDFATMHLNDARTTSETAQKVIDEVWDELLSEMPAPEETSSIATEEDETVREHAERPVPSGGRPATP